MKRVFVIVLFIVFSNSLFAQMPDFTKDTKTAMAKFGIMIGKWEGKSWTIGDNGLKKYSNVTETIQWKLNNSTILIEGLGKNEAGKEVHNALGVVFYDPMQKKYRIHSHLESGLSTFATFEVVEPNKKFEWWFEDGRGGTVKYKIVIDGNKWKEEGEYVKGGVTIMKFFEMNLTKIE